MPSTSIKISQLANLGAITTDDFIALVDSGSLTTYKVSIATWNALWDTYGSSSHANSASVAINATSASYSLSGSYCVTASYAFTASTIYAGGVFGTVTSASYSLSSSYAISGSFASSAISSSWALSSSYAFSSSNAFTSSYAISASRAISSSHASVADALSSPTSVTVPPLVKSLYVYPQTGSISGESSNQITILADELILYSNSGVAVRLSNVSQTNDRTTSGAGGIHGPWGNNEWYDIYVIYNSGTTTTSTMITSSGATPKQTVVAYPSGIPSGYDYAVRVGSVKHEGDSINPMWREWYEYGTNTTWVYRKTLWSTKGLSSGITATHYLGAAPRRTWVWFRLNQNYAPWGYTQGDWLREDDFISDLDDGQVESQPIGMVLTSNQLKFWKSKADNGFENTIYTGNVVSWNAVIAYLDAYIYSER